MKYKSQEGHNYIIHDPLFLEPMRMAPRDGTCILVKGPQFDGGWWQLDDGKNYEIAMRGNEADLEGWCDLPMQTVGGKQ